MVVNDQRQLASECYCHFFTWTKEWLIAFCREDGIEEEDSDEESEEEESSEEESSEEEAGPAAPAAPELTRQQRREMKKKQGPKVKDAKAKPGEEDEDEDEDDEDLINPNHVQKKMNISDLGEPRELTRRERYAPAHLNTILNSRS